MTAFVRKTSYILRNKHNFLRKMHVPNGPPYIYWAEKRRAIELIEMAPYLCISRNIEGHNIEDKYTALFQNLMKPSLKSSSTIYDYVNLQELDDICQISGGDKKQTRRQNIIWLKSCFPGGGGGGGGGGW